VGRESARLETEKANLLDMVWLSAPPAQINQLSSRDGQLVRDKSIQLERGALAIELVKEG
jgi:hypothetical protein